MLYEVITGSSSEGYGLSVLYIFFGLFITGSAIFLNSPYYVRVVMGLLDDPVIMESQRLVWAMRLLLSYFVLSGGGGVIVAFVAVLGGVVTIALVAAAFAFFIWLITNMEST
jgi:hypothetical protein